MKLMVVKSNFRVLLVPYYRVFRIYIRTLNEHFGRPDEKKTQKVYFIVKRLFQCPLVIVSFIPKPEFGDASDRIFKKVYA